MFEKVLDDETVLLQRLQTGDQSAFTAVYYHYHSSVYEQVLQFVHSPQMAEDIAQEVFLKIWESRQKLGEVRSFKSYLFITARNHTLNVLKSAARSEIGLSEIIRHFDVARNTTEEEVQNNEYIEFIRRKLEELPPRTKEIFRLCREQSKTYDEVAAELGITRDAVKSRMVHAMKTLKDSIEKELGLPFAIFIVLISRL